MLKSRLMPVDNDNSYENDVGRNTGNQEAGNEADIADKVFENTLVFTFHHGIIDGQSIMRFYHDVCEELSLCSTVNADADAEADTALPPIVPRPLLPALHEVMPAEYFYINPVFKFLLYAFYKIMFLLKVRVTQEKKKPCAFLKVSNYIL